MAQPDDRAQRLAEAEALRLNGDYGQALHHYDALLAENQRDHPARHGRALCCCFLGEFHEALTELERLRDEAPEYVAGRVDLVKTYLMLGLQESARREMMRLRDEGCDPPW